MLLSLYLAVLDDQSKEEQFIDVYNIYKRLVYHLSLIHILFGKEEMEVLNTDAEPEELRDFLASLAS